MAIFKYKAITKDGKEISGSLEAETILEVRNILVSKNLIPIEIKEPTKSLRKKLDIKIFRKSASSEDIILILYQLGLLIEKNVHITSAIEIIAKEQENEELKNSLLKIKSLISEGKSIADAFNEVKIFPEFIIEMIRAGEFSGALSKIFLSASSFLEKQNSFKSNIINALIYPSIVITVGFLALIIIMNIVVPTVVKIYTQFGKELPLSTKIVIIFSKIFSITFKLIPIFLILGFLINKKYLKEDFWDKFKMKIPFFNKIFLYSQISSWANTMAILLEGGVLLTKAIEISSAGISNKILQKLIKETVYDVEKGRALSVSLKEKNIFPENVVQLIAIGEETGQIEDIFKMIAEIYKKQTEKLINRFITLLEPLTLIILSILIGFFIFATLFPIFNISVKK
ncbi:type II secretion system F family protein [Venenivibrio stagnispumantis]|uniref:General secretion pathway protein F/type IV pilus assembly protein PilC n=1 Tax=Venenivibrio stagnispumantis TaxID=407998 RepID=A0AA45WQ59_9AQUI|nr:type II secretion system F family protein [Venenivibrio stagnispumantis]MCW4573351.1 type II secretion system F family protein [Venenivibrio stagnispumantis]SMP24089.1 general secretion pathway protein F/type IV pilus assembly protein PilC [Venenivibrio stagnispumantis]